MGKILPFDKMQMEYAISTSVSRKRRERWSRLRLVQKLLRIPAVVGALTLVYYVTLPMPFEQWWIAIIGIALLVPYLIAINERID